MYDVIVIGAGPSGSTAAKLLAERGYAVLLLERMKLPRYKSCSGCLIKKSIDLVKQYYNSDVPSEVTCSPTENKGMIFINDKGKTLHFPQPGLNVWRSSFDHWLSKQAVEHGATLWDHAPVISCEQDEEAVTVEIGGEHKCIEQARYIIDCEDITGSIKKKILNCNPAYITTYQTFNKGTIELDLHYFYAYLQPELSEYDAWFNVKEDMLVLGISVKDLANVRKYYDTFIRYMEQQHKLKISKQIKEDRWLMPHIRPGCQINYAKGRIFFAGEIAGWLNPMGEGISCGMESAFHLTQAMSENYEKPTKIEAAYRDKAASLLGYMKSQWSYTGRIAETFAEMQLSP